MAGTARNMTTATTSSGGAAAGMTAADLAAWALTAADRQFLSRWVQVTYLDPATIARVREQFTDEGGIQLQRFLLPPRAEFIEAAVSERDAAECGLNSWPDCRVKPEYATGVEDQRDVVNTQAVGAAAGAAAAAAAGRPEGGYWAVMGPAHVQRFLQWHEPAAAVCQVDDDATVADAVDKELMPPPLAPPSTSASPASGASTCCQAGAALAAVARQLLTQAPFARLLFALSGVRPVGWSSTVRRFRPGLDYTVAHHGLLEPETVLDATLCFLGQANSSSSGNGDSSKSKEAIIRQNQLMQEAWDDGSAGAYECYIAAEDEELTAAEVYGGDGDDGPLLSVTPASNVLNIVLRDKGTMRFIK